MGWWHHGFGIGGWEMLMVSILGMLLFWGGLLALLYFVVRAATGGGRAASGPAPGRHEPYDILARRFAEGEIDGEQFREMKRLLDEEQ